MSNEPSVYRVVIEPDVLKSLRKLPKDVVERLLRAIEDLGLNPRPKGYIQLKGQYDHLRIRVGKWRIIYDIHDDELVVIVVDVGTRGGIYRKY